MYDLTDLVDMAQQYPQILASTVRQYQMRHHLDDQAMVEYLGLATLHRLQLLCLCERPFREDTQVFLADIGRIVGYSSVSPMH